MMKKGKNLYYLFLIIHFLLKVKSIIFAEYSDRKKKNEYIYIYIYIYSF